MAKNKKRNSRNSKNKKALFIWLTGGALIAALAIAVIAFAFDGFKPELGSKPGDQDQIVSPLDDSQIKDPGKTVEVITKVKIVNDQSRVKGKYSFDFKIPLVSGTGNEELEKSIFDKVKSFFYGYKYDVKNSSMGTSQIDDEAGMANGREYYANGRPLSTFASGKLISVAALATSYTGGAHENNEVKPYNYFVKTSKKMTMEDVVSGKPYNLAKVDAAVKDHIKKNKIQLFDGAGTSVKMKSDNFYMTADELVVFYNEYDIAPFSEGIISVRIPLKNIGYSSK